MDEKIKQTIEEMELVMHNALGCRYFNTKEMKLNNDRFFNREATALYNAGYRKENDTAREILAEIDDLTLCIIDGNNEFEKGYFQAIADMKTAIKDLLKEKYGVDLGG